MSLLSTLDAPEDQGLGATQMHDAAIDAGLVARPERVVTVDEFNTAYREELEAQVERMKQDRTVAELEELEEEGDDDDEIMAQLREKRMAEMREAKIQKTTNREVRRRDEGLKQTARYGACEKCRAAAVSALEWNAEAARVRPRSPRSAHSPPSSLVRPSVRPSS